AAGRPSRHRYFATRAHRSGWEGGHAIAARRPRRRDSHSPLVSNGGGGAPRTASAEAIQRLSTLSRSSASPRAVTRTLLHSFDPPAESPVVGPTVGLEVSEIEDAGIREVLQTPGTAYGAWSILDALLTPTGTGTPFIFTEPLGQAREVKAALSGLFGTLRRTRLPGARLQALDLRP